MKITKNKKGAMGIGTLIIFIAIVLVAAVAATVLITTSTTMQKRAYDTSKKSLHQVATNLDIISVTGISANQTNLTGATHVSDTLHEIAMVLRLSPGADDVDMRRMILTYYTTNVSIKPISYAAGARDNVTYVRNNSASDYGIKYLETPEAVADRDNILESGETVKIHFWIEDSSVEYPIGTDVDFMLTLIPEIGLATGVEITTPGRIENVYTDLYP